MKEQIPEGKWRRSLRLIFIYEGDKIRLKSQQSVTMIPPAPTTKRSQEKQSGFWYELRDQDGRPVYYKVMHNPIRFDVEVFDVPGEEIIRQPIEYPRGTFQLLVPDTKEARELVLFSSPLKPEAAGEPAREIARFILKAEGGRKED